VYNNSVFLDVFKKEMVGLRKKRHLRDTCQNTGWWKSLRVPDDYNTESYK